MPTQREKFIRLDIADRLAATGAVDRAQILMSPFSEASSHYPLYVCIEPHAASLTAAAGMSAGAGTSTGAAVGYDAALTGTLLYTGTALVTVFNSDPDHQEGDDAMELVLDNLANAVNGQSLADTTLPADTIVSQWTWQDETNKKPRLLLITVRYVFMLDGWDGFDTTP